MSEFARDVARDPSWGARAAVAFAAFVRLHPASGSVVKSSTVANYVDSVAKLLKKDFFTPDWRLLANSDSRDPDYKRLLAHFKRNDKGRLIRSPLRFAHLRAWANKERAEGRDPLQSHAFRWLVIGMLYGMRGSEFLRTYHRLRTDTTFKVIHLDDIVFLDKRERPLLGNFSRGLAKFVDVTWRFQKNGDNGVTRRLPCNDDPLFCPVQRALDARDHDAKEAGSVANPPAALGNHGSHITTAKMVKFIRATVTAFDPSIPKEELIRYTVHSIRIGSLFRLLNNCAATDSISVDVVAHFLRWNSTAYQLYVRSCGTNFAKLSNKDKSELAAQFDKDADHDPEVDGDFANLV